MQKCFQWIPGKILILKLELMAICIGRYCFSHFRLSTNCTKNCSRKNTTHKIKIVLDNTRQSIVPYNARQSTVQSVYCSLKSLRHLYRTTYGINKRVIAVVVSVLLNFTWKYYKLYVLYFIAF